MRLPTQRGAEIAVQRNGRLSAADGAAPEFMGPGWSPVGKLGLAYKDEGVYLRDQPLPGSQSERLAQLPQNTRLIILRANPDTGWYMVRVQGGDHSGRSGYVAQSHVRDDLPDPASVMHRVSSGETLGGLVQSHPQYASYDIRTGDDARSLATAVYVANKDKGVRLNLERFEAQDSWFEGFLDVFDDYRSEMRRIYQSVELVAGTLIWLPGVEYVGRLKRANIIPTRPDWKNAAIEAGKAIGGFTTGLVDGFLGSIAEAVEGLYDIGKSIVDLIIDLATGEALSKAEELYDYFANLTEDELKALAVNVISSLATGVAQSVNAFLSKWNATHVYNKWHFRGSVVGGVLSEVVMLLLSGGTANAVKWLGKLGKLGAKLTSTVQKIATKVDDLPGRRRDRVDHDQQPDGDTGERALALAKAKAIAEIHDAADVPIPGLLAALKPLTRYTGVNGFKAEPLSQGAYRIVMRTVVHPRYTPGAFGVEVIETFDTLNEARAAARRAAGLGSGGVPFIQKLGPQKGRVTGSMSPDGLRGWRLDYDPTKGYHVNWWDKTAGKGDRTKWRYGANIVKGGTEDDFLALLEHFPKL